MTKAQVAADAIGDILRVREETRMGCDFELTGYQPDPDIQERCLKFLTDFVAIRGTGPARWNEVPRASNRRLLTVQRGTHLIFGRRGLAPHELGYTGIEPYRRDAWRGGVFELVEGCHPLEVTFDRERNGTLCHNPVLHGDHISYCDTADTPLVRSRVLMRLGTHSRFPTGNAAPYVVAYVLRTRYFEALTVEADYDVAYYQDLLADEGLGFGEMLNAAEEADLPDVASRVTNVAHMMMEALVEVQWKALQAREAAEAAAAQAAAQAALSPQDDDPDS